MGRVVMYGQTYVNTIVSHDEKVIRSVHNHAESIYKKAQARRAAHYHEGQAEVLLLQGDVDSYVVLDDPQAMSIELGHDVENQYGPTGKHLEGLHIITGAAGLV